MTMDQEITNSDLKKYPADNIDLRKMNRILRHRLRNLCAGVKMTAERIASITSQSHPQIGERCNIIISELDNLQTFTDRMDMLFDNLPAPEKRTLFDILCHVREFFIKKYPFCHLVLEGREISLSLAHGSWFAFALKEIVANAGESAGANGTVKINWGESENSVSIRVSNTGESVPSEIPINPPQPFNTLRSRHDGIGLAIAHRICSESTSSMHVESTADLTVVEIKLSPEEISYD